MKLGRFLSNIYDPRLPNARMYLTYSFHAHDNGKAGMDREWQAHLDWVNKNIIGPPKATDYYTQEELEAEKMVGIYAHPE